jgi:methionine-rich copper-binding protein CopC
MVGLITLAAAMVLPATAMAHADLASASPADGDDLEQAPDEVRLAFTEELDPDGSEFVVTDAAGDEVGRGEVDLDVADRNELSGSVTIRDPGLHTVAWSVISSDGHEASGSYTFGYRTSEASSPDTRVIPSRSSSPILLGLLLVAVALIIARRRAMSQ